MVYEYISSEVLTIYANNSFYAMCNFFLLLNRAEANLLRQHVEAQAKELIQRKQKLEELEEKERVANDNVTCLYIFYKCFKKCDENQGMPEQ